MEPLIKSGFVKGTASEPVLSEAEGCRKWLARNAALAAEGTFGDLIRPSLERFSLRWSGLGFRVEGPTHTSPGRGLAAVSDAGHSSHPPTSIVFVR